MTPTFASTALGLLTIASTLSYARAQIDFQPCPELNENITSVNGVPGSTFECAQLSVPLDYTNPDSESLELDLFRVAAIQEPVLGSILLNFGGPGGTAAENLPVLAEQLHELLGEQYNLVSWDPRGTGNTIPFRCDVSTLIGGAPPTTKRDIGTLVSTNLTEVFLNDGWEAAGMVADTCFDEANETGRLIGTAFTARDMIQIVDALGEDGLLRYYGVSYGTALGSYVAAMFPERVERMILDANINPLDYQAGHYEHQATDTDEAFAGFVQTCFDVRDQCALYTLLQPNAPQDLLDSLNLVLAPLAQNATSSLEAYLTYVSVKSIVLQPLYYPATWPRLAGTLASILNGTTPAASPPRPTYGTALNAVVGIRSSDATFIANTTEEYLPIVQAQAAVSAGFSDIAYFVLWASARWRLPAQERYWGNFQVTTKTPILYVNSQFDPVAPLVNARNASEGFEGSVVLAHNGYGHGIYAHPSQCVNQYTRAYFSNASLPEANTICESDSTLVELWQARLAQEEDGAINAPGSNSTDESADDSTNNTSTGNSTAEQPENAAGRGSTNSAFALAGALMIAALTFL